MSAVVKWCVLPIPCRCHSGSLCFGGVLNAAAFPTSCLPCWHMEGLSRSALFALWHSTEFVEEQRCTRTRAPVELEPNRKSQTSETFTILCFRHEKKESRRTPISCLCESSLYLSANNGWLKCFLVTQKFVTCATWLAKHMEKLWEDQARTRLLSGNILATEKNRDMNLNRTVNLVCCSKSHCWQTHTAAYRKPRALYIVVPSAFTLFTSDSEITDGGEVRSFVRSHG